MKHVFVCEVKPTLSYEIFISTSVTKSIAWKTLAFDEFNHISRLVVNVAVERDCVLRPPNKKAHRAANMRTHGATSRYKEIYESQHVNVSITWVFILRESWEVKPGVSWEQSLF